MLPPSYFEPLPLTTTQTAMDWVFSGRSRALPRPPLQPNGQPWDALDIVMEVELERVSLVERSRMPVRAEVGRRLMAGHAARAARLALADASHHARPAQPATAPEYLSSEPVIRIPIVESLGFEPTRLAITSESTPALTPTPAPLSTSEPDPHPVPSIQAEPAVAQADLVLETVVSPQPAPATSSGGDIPTAATTAITAPAGAASTDASPGNKTEQPECPICQEPYGGAIMKCKPTGCIHEFCVLCLRRWIQTQHQQQLHPHCPMCRTDMRAITTLIDETQQRRHPNPNHPRHDADVPTYSVTRSVPRHQGAVYAVINYEALVARLRDSRPLGCHEELMLLLDAEDLLGSLKIALDRYTRAGDRAHQLDIDRLRPVIRAVVDATNKAIELSRERHFDAIMDDSFVRACIASNIIPGPPDLYGA